MAKENKKQNKTEVKEKEQKTVLIKPRITEKTVLVSDSRGIYAFNVEKDATRKSVVASVKAKYKVTPIRVRLLSVQGKRKQTRGIWGKRGTGKKAYVYLKKGDKIDVA